MSVKRSGALFLFLLLVTSCDSERVAELPPPSPSAAAVATSPVTPAAPAISPSDNLTSYQILQEMRKIEGFSGGTYSRMLNDTFYFYISNFFDPEADDSDNRIQSYRKVNRKTGDVSHHEKGNVVTYYNLYKPETYPKQKVNQALSSEQTEQLKRIMKLEQQFYANPDIYNAEWSPDISSIAYSQGNEQEGQSYIWQVSKAAPQLVTENIDPELSFYNWSPDSQYLLIDTGTSRQRGGALYQVETGRLSGDFRYLSRFYFSPDSKYAVFSRLSGIISKAKWGYEDDETDDLWVMELSTFAEKLIRKADDHTGYFGLGWENDSTFNYEQFDYASENRLTKTLQIREEMNN
ncbi:MAG: hypothetical protein K0Q90_745 [Paenibacillaceae bacterium]|nr:hypothetical protein [Paenibacillaceae bacterium]